MNGSSPSIPIDTQSADAADSHARTASPSAGEANADRAITELSSSRSESAPGESIRATSTVRLIALAISLMSLSTLLVAAIWLPPLPAGLGTHTQLGFPPCRWVTSAGIPCPTCGMTTSFSHAVRLELLDGFLTQPFGFLLALATAAAFWMGLYVAATGSLSYRCFTALWRPGFVWTLAALALVAWLFKIWSYTHGGVLNS